MLTPPTDGWERGNEFTGRIGRRPLRFCLSLALRRSAFKKRTRLCWLSCLDKSRSGGSASWRFSPTRGVPEPMRWICELERISNSGGDLVDRLGLAKSRLPFVLSHGATSPLIFLIQPPHVPIPSAFTHLPLPSISNSTPWMAHCPLAGVKYTGVFRRNLWIISSVATPRIPAWEPHMPTSVM